MADNTINIDLVINASKSAKTISEQREALKKLREGLEQVKYGSGAFELLTEAVSDLQKEMGLLNLTFEDAYGEIKPLTSQIGELEDRLYQMALAGQQNTEEFKQVQAETVKLKQALRDVDDTVDALAQRGARLQGFIKITQGIAGGFAVAQSGLKLFGIESDKVEKSLQQTATIIELLAGLEALSTSFKEKNVIVLGIQNALRATAVRLAGQQAVAEAAEAAAAGTATVAQRALNAAMAANPIGILITLILAGVSALALWSSSTEDATKANEDLNTSIQRRNDLLGTLNETETKGLEARNNATIAALESEKSAIEKSIALIELKTERTAAENSTLANLNTQLKNKNLQIIDEEKKAALQQLNYEKKVNAEKLALLKKDMVEKDRLAQQDSDLIKEANDAKLAYEKAFLEENLKTSTVALQDGTIVEGEYLARKNAINAEAIQKKAQIQNDAIVKDAQIDEKAKQDAIKKEQEYRKLLLEGINSTLNRNKDASNQLRQLKAEEMKDLMAKELELQQIKFESNQQALVDKAIERELKANEDKFTQLKISQKEFEANKLTIAQNGVTNLTQSEKELYDFYATQNTNRITAIKNRFATEAKISVAETKKINAELALLEFEYNQETKKNAVQEIDLQGQLSKEAKKTLEEEIRNRQKTIQGQIQSIETVKRQIEVTKEAQKSARSTEEREAYDEAIKKGYEKLDLINSEIDANQKIVEEKAKQLQIDEDLYGPAAVEAKKKVEAEKLKITQDGLSKEIELKNNVLKAEEELLLENKTKQLADETLTAEQKLKIEAQYQLDLANLRKKAKDDQMTSISEITKGTKEAAETTKNWYEKLAEDQKALFDGTIKFVNEMSQLVADLISRQADANIAQIERDRDARMTAFEEQQTIADMRWNDAETKDYIELNRQNEIAAQRAAIEEEYAAKIREEKRKAFNAQKAASIIEIGINTAVSVSKTLYNPILAAIVGFAGAAQAAFVASQPTPEFAKGGILDGPSHAQGGIKTAYGELEGGEAIINKKSTKMFAPMLSAINEVGGGVKFADGGTLPTTPVTMNNSTDLMEIKGMLREFANKPILTYVNESEVTRAQRNQRKIEKRTTF